MIIANPIFDTVFKRLMENNRIARFFVETIIGQTVESIALTPQEHTYFKKPRVVSESGLVSEQLEKIELLTVFRFDFVATIRTPGGYKKVLIEIQKARNTVDLMRFRTYLAEQYKRKDVVQKDGVEQEEPLPIITIYLLGYKLAETDAVVISVDRTYRDVLKHKELHLKSEFIECLTHDSFVVQLSRIEGKTRTRLEQMLSIFEQNYFIDDKGIRKKYDYEVDDQYVREMVEILYHTGADPEQQKDIEDEWWSNELLLELTEEKDRKIEEQKKNLEKSRKTIEEKDKAIEESRKTIEESRKTIEESRKTIEESKKAIEEKDKAIEALQNELERLRGKQ